MKNIIVDTQGCDAIAVVPEAILKSLGADSRAAVNLMMAMEKTTGMTNGDEGMASLQMAGSIADSTTAHQD